MSTVEKSAKPFRILSPLPIVGALVGLAIVGWLAFGFFGVQTLFTDKVVEEAGPTFASTASEPAAEVEDTSSIESTSAPEPESAAADDEPAPTTTAPAAPEIVTLAAGDFIDRDHPTAGVASVLTDGSSQRFLRFEDFETDNGPDLNVYLSTAEPDSSNGDLGADFVDLGDLKGNQGSQNYEIPTDVDLSKYKTVVIWCVRFGVPFGTAPLV